MTTRVFYSMKCILFVLLLTSGSFSLLTKGQILVDLLKDREFINILDKGNTLLKKKTNRWKEVRALPTNSGEKIGKKYLHSQSCFSPTKSLRKVTDLWIKRQSN